MFFSLPQCRESSDNKRTKGIIDLEKMKKEFSIINFDNDIASIILPFSTPIPEVQDDILMYQELAPKVSFGISEFSYTLSEDFNLVNDRIPNKKKEYSIHIKEDRYFATLYFYAALIRSYTIDQEKYNITFSIRENEYIEGIQETFLMQINHNNSSEEVVLE